MKLYEDLCDKQEKIAVVGLGYVGLPLAMEFGKKYETIGFDIKEKKVEELSNGYDSNHEITDEEFKNTKVEYTSDPQRIRDAKFIVVAVPTPIDNSKRPNLSPVYGASKIIGQNLSKGSIIVYESTVYPGVTEDECVPILEKESGLKCGIDFKVGYSPERINPGDKINTVTKIVKVVSGQDEESARIIVRVYASIITAGVHLAPSIKVAEAAKVIENTQRDLNIALMNELSIIFNIMGINTNAVIEAASTKWNFIKMQPGLVGGHCISVDPYYLTHKAQMLGYIPEVILAGRRINDNMGKHVATETVKHLIKAGHTVKDSKVVVFGVTFKENVADFRNTKVLDVINELESFGVETFIVDPLANPEDFKAEYGRELIDMKSIKDVTGIIVASPHQELIDMGLENLSKLFVKKPDTQNVFVDVKGVFEKEANEIEDLIYWML